MDVETKAKMVASMLESVEHFGLTVSEINTFIDYLADYRDSIDTDLHDQLRKALADTTIVRVLHDPVENVG